MRLLGTDEPSFDESTSAIAEALASRTRTKLVDLSESQCKELIHNLFSLLKACRPLFETKVIEEFRDALTSFTLQHSAKDKLIIMRTAMLDEKSAARTWRQKVVLLPWRAAADGLRDLARLNRLQSRNTLYSRNTSEPEHKKWKTSLSKNVKDKRRKDCIYMRLNMGTCVNQDCKYKHEKVISD